MIIYEVRWDEGYGTQVEWYRNKAQAEKRKRELDWDVGSGWPPEIVQHVIEPNKDGIVGFLNCIHVTDNG